MNSFVESHTKAAEYWVESVNNEIGFWGMPCKNFGDIVIGACLQYGDHKVALTGGVLETLTYKPQGLCYLKTAKHPPYALGLKWIDP